MLKFVYSLVFALLSAMMLDCGSARASYKFQIKQVARGDAQADESRSIKLPLIFENAEIKTIWTPDATTYYFRIENKSKADLQLNFAKSFLISSGGNAFAAIHPGNSAIAKGSDVVIVPSGAGVDTWIRPGQQQGQNNEGLSGALAPGWSGGGFFPETGNAEDLKAQYGGKTVTIVLSVNRSGKDENYRFTLQVADVIVE